MRPGFRNIEIIAITLDNIEDQRRALRLFRCQPVIDPSKRRKGFPDNGLGITEGRAFRKQNTNFQRVAIRFREDRKFEKPAGKGCH